MRLGSILWDIIAPRRCVCCYRLGTWLCPRCIGSVHYRLEQKCYLCKKRVSPYGSLCNECRGKENLKNILVTVDYDTGSSVRKLIHLYKYRFVNELNQILGKMIAGSLRDTSIPLPDLIIPIPLHKRRLRWRGFNQAELLAEVVAAEMVVGIGFEVATDVLIRKRYTTSQVTHNRREQRLANIREAFVVDKPEKIAGKSILLIDDVATTGATLSVAADVLKQAGAGEVYSAVIARGK